MKKQSKRTFDYSRLGYLVPFYVLASLIVTGIYGNAGLNMFSALGAIPILMGVYAVLRWCFLGLIGKLPKNGLL